MSAPDNERTFVPAELDALEDALEQSPATELRFAAELDDAARARIHSTLIHYRAIERHARGLLLEAAPPATLLADVIAQAHAAVAAPVVAPESTWSRIKSRWLRPIWVVPSLAALGSAAVALFIVMAPQKQAELASERAVVAQSAPEPAAAKREMPALAESSELPAAPAEEQRGEGLMLERKSAGIATDESSRADTRARDVVGRAESARRFDDAPRPAPADPAPNKPKKSPSSGGGSAGPSAAPGGTPSPTTAPPAPKSTKTEAEHDDAVEPSAQQRLTRADEARRRGDCDAARNDYDAVVDTGTAKQKARARAGLALCLERAGDLAQAKSLIEQARRDDNAIDSWLDAQR